MDGENNGSKPYEQMDALAVFYPLFLVQHPFSQKLDHKYLAGGGFKYVFYVHPDPWGK